MINKKLSDLFLRKQAKKQQPKQVVYFDENTFFCKLVSKGINTDLIKIQSKIKQSGQPLDQIKCKWYIKNSRDFKQIQDVNSTYYQPCLDDVGSSICVQIEPFIEGKKYNGITIMQETNPLQIDSQLENKLDEFLQHKFLKIQGKIQTIYSQNQKFQELELPLDVKIEICPTNITLKSGENVIEKICITQQYPNLQFIRKSFSSIIINYNEKQSMKLSLNNNFNRDLFALIIRTCAAHSSDKQPSINPQKIVQAQEQKANQQKKQQSKKESIISQFVEYTVCQNNENHDLVMVQKDKQLPAQKTKSDSGSPSMSSSQSLEVVKKNIKQTQNEKIYRNEEKQSSTMFVLKLDQQNKEIKSLRRNYQDLRLNYNIQKQAKCQIEKKYEILFKQFQIIKKERDQAFNIARKYKQLKQNNRFYKNEISILKKELKDQKQKAQCIQNKLRTFVSEKDIELDAKKLKAQEQIQNIKSVMMESNRRKEEAESEIQRYRKKIEDLQNENLMLKKKLESLANEKGIAKPFVQTKKTKVDNENDQKIKDLQMKLKNLQMLLRYKSTQGEVNSNFQMLVCKLTETISEKQIQLNEVKKINKSLLEQLKLQKQKKK